MDEQKVSTVTTAAAENGFNSGYSLEIALLEMEKRLWEARVQNRKLEEREIKSIMEKIMNF